jgi:hypothetical protein
MHFHCNGDYTNMPQCYVRRTLPVLLISNCFIFVTVCNQHCNSFDLKFFRAKSCMWFFTKDVFCEWCRVCVCVCVRACMRVRACVCVRERERERDIGNSRNTTRNQVCWPFLQRNYWCFFNLYYVHVMYIHI